MLDADRLAFMETYKVECGIRENGYWWAQGSNDSTSWVSRKTIAQCIDVLMQYHPSRSANSSTVGLK
jgi:hypothetical protein